MIDCVNFRGYEDSSPTAKVGHDAIVCKGGSSLTIPSLPQIQAKYTDCLLLNKHDLVSERDLDTVLDHLYELNDETPVVRVSKDSPLRPELVFGLDTKLFTEGSREVADWEALGLGDMSKHADEVETRSVWLGGGKPGKGKKRAANAEHADGEQRHHKHPKGEECDSCDGEAQEKGQDEACEGPVRPMQLDVLEAELARLPFEIYRGEWCWVGAKVPLLTLSSVKGFIRTAAPDDSDKCTTFILNWAFGRHELTAAPELDQSPDLAGVSLRLTMMGARGEVAKRARSLAEKLGAEMA